MLQWVEGRILHGQHRVSALAGALFSVTLVPALASLVYRRTTEHRESPVLRWQAALYESSLRFALSRGW